MQRPIISNWLFFRLFLPLIPHLNQIRQFGFEIPGYFENVIKLWAQKFGVITSDFNSGLIRK